MGGAIGAVDSFGQVVKCPKELGVVNIVLDAAVVRGVYKELFHGGELVVEILLVAKLFYDNGHDFQSGKEKMINRFFVTTGAHIKYTELAMRSQRELVLLAIESDEPIETISLEGASVGASKLLVLIVGEELVVRDYLLQPPLVGLILALKPVNLRQTVENGVGFLFNTEELPVLQCGLILALSEIVGTLCLVHHADADHRFRIGGALCDCVSKELKRPPVFTISVKHYPAFVREPCRIALPGALLCE